MKSEQNISRLEIFCNDALVMPIKRMLLGMKGVHRVDDQPVVNAIASKKHGVQAKTDGSTIAMFMDHCRRHELDAVTRTDADEFCREVGRPITAAGYLIKRGQELGYLVKNKARSGGKSFVYDVKG